RQQAEHQRLSADLTASFMTDLLDGVKSSVARGRDTTILLDLLDAAAKRILDGELRDSPESELRLRWTIGEADVEIAAGGALQFAETMLAPTLELAQRTSGAESIAMAHSLNDIGWWLSKSGRIKEALGKHEAALQMRQRLFDGDHEHVALSLTNVGGCLI